MSRKGNTPKRDVLPDAVYNSKLITKLINGVMLDGKKGTAQTIVYGAFNIVKEKTGEEPMIVFEKALNNIKKDTAILSAFLAEKWQTQKFGRDIVFSADLCYNGVGDKNGRGKRIAEKKTNKAKKF